MKTKFDTQLERFCKLAREVTSAMPIKTTQNSTTRENCEIENFKRNDEDKRQEEE